MSEGAVAIVNTSIIMDDSKSGVTNEERAMVDGRNKIASMDKADLGHPHSTTGRFGDTQASLMVEEVADYLDISSVVRSVWRWSKGDDGPLTRFHKRLTSEEVVGAAAR